MGVGMGFGKTAAIVVIGNEVLSGKVLDQNSPYLVGELRQLGVHVQRIAVIPDQVEVIAEEIAFCKNRFDWVFTSGGIGPTHDDVTMEGLATGVGRPLICHPVLERFLKKIYPGTLNAAQQKLTFVPEGVDFVYAEGIRIPILHFENIYVFPGVPSLLMKKFSAIKERFRGSPFYLSKIFLVEEEYKIAQHLHQTLEKFPYLLIGSYPIMEHPDYRVVITMESKERDYLEGASAFLLSMLDEKSVFKMERVVP